MLKRKRSGGEEGLLEQLWTTSTAAGDREWKLNNGFQKYMREGEDGETDRSLGGSTGEREREGGGGGKPLSPPVVLA